MLVQSAVVPLDDQGDPSEHREEGLDEADDRDDGDTDRPVYRCDGHRFLLWIEARRDSARSA